MKLKEINISKEEVKKIFDEELLLFLHEEHEAGRLDENFLKHLKNAGKGMFDYYKMMMKYKKLCLYNEISFIDWLKRKNIINAHLIHEFNNNIKMYHLKCDKKEIKITKNRKQMDVIYSILEEEHFIFP